MSNIALFSGNLYKYSNYKTMSNSALFSGHCHTCGDLRTGKFVDHTNCKNTKATAISCPSGVCDVSIVGWTTNFATAVIIKISSVTKS